MTRSSSCCPDAVHPASRLVCRGALPASRLDAVRPFRRRSAIHCLWPVLLGALLGGCQPGLLGRGTSDGSTSDDTARLADLHSQGDNLASDADGELRGDTTPATETSRDSTAPAADGQPDATPGPDTQGSPLQRLLYDGANLQFTVADNGFHGVIMPGDPLPLANWSSPVNYYAGELRIRYRIQGPANQQAGKLQICIWTLGNADGDGKNYFPESCSDIVTFAGVGEVLGTKLVPSAWWKNAGVPLDFSHPERFRIGVVLRGPSGCNVTTYNVTNACWSEWPNYQDMTFRVTLVMVPPGTTFSGWASYP